MKIMLPKVRLSFPSLFNKAKFQGNETKYEATFLLDKEIHAKTLKDLHADISDIQKVDFKGNKLPTDKICLKDGANSGFEGYENLFTLKASNQNRPLVLNKDKTPLTENDEKLYAGCYVNAFVELWPMNNAYGKRVCAKLLGVQFVADGEPFSGNRGASVNDFEVIDDEDEIIQFA